MFYYTRIYPHTHDGLIHYTHSNLSFTFRTARTQHYVYFFTNLETNTKHTIPTGQTAVRVTGNFSFLTMCAHAGYRPNIFTCTRGTAAAPRGRRRRRNICMYIYTRRGPHNIIIHVCVCIQQQQQHTHTIIYNNNIIS